MGYADNGSDRVELSDMLRKWPLCLVYQPEWVGQDSEEGLELGIGFVSLEGPHTRNRAPTEDRRSDKKSLCLKGQVQTQLFSSGLVWGGSQMGQKGHGAEGGPCSYVRPRPVHK